jgi:antitoxin component YwqK of YwqJK toxin-antitoxin module
MMNNLKAISTLILLGIGFTMLFSQNADEEYDMLHQYKLSDKAVSEQSLTVQDSLSFLNSKLFNGVAFSSYDNKHIKQVTWYKNGMKHGSQYIWYPDGKPLLFSNYKFGHLNGRFKGWYQFGGVIYDMYMKDSSFGGDQRYDDDTTRATGTDTETDSNADGKDQSND